MSAASISVVVVARNEEQRIGACIASLAAQDLAEFEVILVDDGSTDATVSLARETLPGLHVISSPTRSISRNRDIGWRAARGDLIAFLDADCIAPRHWLSTLARAAEATGAAAVGGGNVPPEETSPHYDALRLMLDTFVGSRGSVQGKVPMTGAFVRHLPGLNVMFRREALERVGGYDPRFARMAEDEDLSIRLTDLGWKLWVEPGATVVHRQRADLASWTRNMRAYGRGRTWLLRRHPNVVSPLFLIPPVALALFPLYLAMIAIYAGFVAVAGGRPKLWPRLVALFAATHLAYAVGQIEGLFIRGDNPDATRPRARIALLALKNAGNKGDEAISACVSARLTRTLRIEDAAADLYLGAIGPNGFDIRAVPADPTARDMLIGDMLASSETARGVQNSTLSAIPVLLSVAAGFRAMVIAGGQWLHDLSLGKHIAVCGVFAFARVFGTRTGVFCIGAGPLRRTFSRRLLRVAFSRRSLMVTRDEASAALLRDCGLSQALAATDPAIELETAPMVGTQGKVLISPCAWSSFENLYALASDEIAQSLAEWRRVVEGLLEMGEKVAILPTMNPEDTHFAHRLIEGLGDVTIVDTERLTPAQIQGCIAGAKALVSMRLHPLIFASNVSTPIVAISYAAKVEAYCAQAGLGDRLVRIDCADWSSRVLEIFRRAPDAAQARTARAAQQSLLADAYSQFDQWTLPNTDPAARFQSPKGLNACASLSSTRR